MIVGEKIKKLIELSGKSVKEVADEIGMTNQNLYKILKKDSVESQLLTLFANKFDVPITYFFDNKPSGKANAASIGNSNTTIAVAEGGSRYEVGTSGAKDEERNRLVAENEMLKRLIAEKDLLIAEKERMIQVLMKREG